MEYFNRFTAPATDKLRQLQKMVQDIKKNDDSLFNRLKRFQNEQTANILETGRNTLNRIKKKRPPTVPVRDYQGEAPDSEKDSDSDFDSDTYEDPQGDHDDNYEPPPRLEGHMKAFTISPSITNPRGEYDSDTYEDPQGDHDDNYEPPPRLEGHMKAFTISPSITNPRGEYENSQSKTRSNTTLQPNTHMALPKASPRMNIRMPTITPQEPQSEDEYEVCDADDSVSEGPEEATEARRPSMPTPRPRDLKKPNPALTPKPNIAHRDSEATSIKTTPVTISRSPPDTMPSPMPTGFHRAKYMPPPRQLPSQSRGTLPSESRSARDAEEEAGVYKKVWYASSCDRKTAEDALLRSAKRFSSVSDIIENHQKNPLVLVDSQSNTKDSTKLRHAVKP
ncbi:B-cell linker protein-like [Sinocyclocheilus grahami]|uniref:B-cell linker protein-like n=1 Tax=Sinocyclocheilus grahami TaxID=75366 RepID=UPI0007ACFA12|nr:PREDICTED: B-cell linker protein-like [Sinocyclocheilus grahami]